MYLTSRARISDYTARGWWGADTVDDLLQRNRLAMGSRMALVDPANRLALEGRSPRRLSWGELGDEVDRMASALLGLGLAKDDLVCLQLPNVVETVVTVFACARIGLIVSPVVMQYREHELTYILDLLRPAAFVTVGSFGGHDHAAMALRLRRPDRGYKVMALTGGGPEEAADLENIARRSDPTRAALYHDSQPAGAGEVFTVCWTSGTESRPKGVPRDHNHWMVSGAIVAEAADMREGEIVLNPFPLVNIAAFGLAMAWLKKQAVMVLHHPFDLAVFLRQIAEERVNYTIAPPAILNMLLKSPKLKAAADLSSVRSIGSGSAPLSPWMIEGFRADHGIEVCNIFGSNEGATLFSDAARVPDPADRARYFPRFGADGVTWAGKTPALIRTRLCDPATGIEITGPGVAGELRIAGAATFSGYYRSPDLDAAAFDADGWFKTGDLFEIAGEGDLARYYRFVGRCKDIIVRGGVNISPGEIDNLLAGWPKAREAAVVGLPDEVLGERMCLVVVPAGEPPSLEDAKAWLSRSGLAVFKLPERIVMVDALPRNAMNKVLRSALRDKVLGLASSSVRRRTAR